MTREQIGVCIRGRVGYQKEFLPAVIPGSTPIQSERPQKSVKHQIGICCWEENLFRHQQERVLLWSSIFPITSNGKRSPHYARASIYQRAIFESHRASLKPCTFGPHTSLRVGKRRTSGKIEDRRVEKRRKETSDEDSLETKRNSSRCNKLHLLQVHPTTSRSTTSCNSLQTAVRNS